MKMAVKVGFTLDEAEILRRIVGKKKVSEVRKWKKKIKDKVKENNLDPKIGDVLWQILEDSANYSFNYKKNMAFGYVNSGFEVNSFIGKSLEIEVEKIKYEGIIETKPLHDPENKFTKNY